MRFKVKLLYTRRQMRDLLARRLVVRDAEGGWVRDISLIEAAENPGLVADLNGVSVSIETVQYR